MRIKSNYKTVVFLLPFINLVIFSSAFSVGSLYRSMESFLPYINLILIFLSCYEVVKENDIKFFFISIISIFCLISICLINNTSWGALVAFLTSLFSIYYGSKIVIDRRVLHIVVILGYIYLGLAMIRCNDYYFGWEKGLLEINPNMIGLNLALFCIYTNAYYESFEIENNKTFLILYNLLNILMIFKYRSRTSLVVICIFMVLKVFGYKCILKLKNARFLTLIIVISGIVFPIIYCNAPYRLIVLVKKLTGKSFYSGRELIWKRFFDSLNSIRNFLIGPGSSKTVEFGTIVRMNKVYIYSMHNSFLSIMVNLGIIGIIIYLVFILTLLRLNDNRRTIVYTIGFMCFLFAGYTEVCLTYAFTVLPMNMLASVKIEQYSD